MNLVRCACTALVACCVVSPCLAASPWDGTWKLNPSRSKLTGDMFTLTALPNGGFHLLAQGGSLAYDYTCDGKDYAVLTDRTGTCKKIDERHYEMAGKLRGKPVWHGTSVVSGDGKYLTNTAYETRPDGTSDTAVNKYERVGSGRGRAGTWKNVQSSDSAPDVVKISMNDGTMRTEIPAYKLILTAKLDGSLARIEGPTQSPSFTMRFTANSALKLHYTAAVNGKPMLQGTQTLSPDGKTMTQEERLTGDSNGEQSYVYEKQ